MNIKIIIIALTVCGFSFGGYYFYNHYYIETLMLSEIVGHTDNPIVNILVNAGDFDTGITRHDIKKLKDNKDYWLERIQEVNSIENPDLKQQASIKLLSDMMENPTLKKMLSGVLKFGTSSVFGLLEIIL